MSESFITKKAIAEGLKEVLLEKSFDKVSIADITGRCRLNRQTFYYHFQDKYELLTWIYYGELFQKVMEDITFENWHQKIQGMLDKMKAEKSFYMNTIRCARECFSDYLLEITEALFKEAIEALDGQEKLQENEKAFIAQFLAYGVCGVTLSWVENGMKMPTQEVANHLKMVAQDCEKLAYNRYLAAKPSEKQE